MSVSLKKLFPKRVISLGVLLLTLFLFLSPHYVVALSPSQGAAIGSLGGPLGSVIGWFLTGGGKGAVTDAMKGMAAAVTSALIVFLFTLLNALAFSVLYISSGIFKLVTNPNFINFGKGYTTFVNNPVVNSGWTIIRNFTNMLFVLGLVIIALTTIIRYKDYNAKKTLPLLIGVALLINFTPLICGVVIDGANIVMNYFMNIGGKVLPDSFWNALGSQIGTVTQGAWTDVGQLGTRMGKALFILSFNFIAGLVILLFALLFLARYVVLWLLIIISPLAFFAYIFPKSRSYFHQWWKHFLNWSIIGIIPAFLLFLANQLVLSLKEVSAVPNELSGMSTAVLAYMAPTALLLIGFFLALSTSAIGADMITKGFNKHVVGRAKGLAKWYGKGMAKGMAGAAAGAKRGKGMKGKVGGFFKGAFTREGREEGTMAAGRYLEKARLVKPGWYQRQQRENIEKDRKEIEKLPEEKQHEIAKRRDITPTDIRTKIAAVEALAAKGKLTTEEIKEITAPRTLQKLKTFGLKGSDIVKNYPTEEVASAFGENPEEIISKMTPKEASEKIQLENMTPKDQKETIPLLKEPQIKEIGKKASPKRKKTITDYYVRNIARLASTFNLKTRIDPSDLYNSTVSQAKDIELLMQNIKKQVATLEKQGKFEEAEKMKKEAKTLQSITNAIFDEYYG